MPKKKRGSMIQTENGRRAAEAAKLKRLRDKENNEFIVNNVFENQNVSIQATEVDHCLSRPRPPPRPALQAINDPGASRNIVDVAGNNNENSIVNSNCDVFKHSLNESVSNSVPNNVCGEGPDVRQQNTPTTCRNINALPQNTESSAKKRLKLYPNDKVERQAKPPTARVIDIQNLNNELGKIPCPICGEKLQLQVSY